MEVEDKDLFTYEDEVMNGTIIHPTIEIER